MISKTALIFERTILTSPLPKKRIEFDFNGKLLRPTLWGEWEFEFAVNRLWRFGKRHAAKKKLRQNLGVATVKNKNKKQRG